MMSTATTITHQSAGAILTASARLKPKLKPASIRVDSKQKILIKKLQTNSKSMFSCIDIRNAAGNVTMKLPASCVARQTLQWYKRRFFERHKGVIQWQFCYCYCSFFSFWYRHAGADESRRRQQRYKLEQQIGLLCVCGATQWEYTLYTHKFTIEATNNNIMTTHKTKPGEHTIQATDLCCEQFRRRLSQNVFDATRLVTANAVPNTSRRKKEKKSMHNKI